MSIINSSRYHIHYYPTMVWPTNGIRKGGKRSPAPSQPGDAGLKIGIKRSRHSPQGRHWVEASPTPRPSHHHPRRCADRKPGAKLPRMRFLILAIALAFTASPTLGQVRQELQLRQLTEQGNASDSPLDSGLGGWQTKTA